MEKYGLDHDTRLFVSHDAPQQGANIPISVQYMFRHLTNLFNELPTPFGNSIVSVPFLENNILDQPATQQMLMNWVNSNYTIFYDPHTLFYSQLRAGGLANSGGYPVNCRNVAISDGAECGTTQNFNPGDVILSYNKVGGLPLWANLLTPAIALFGGVALNNLELLQVSIVSALPGSSKYNVDFNAKSIHYGSGNQIYKGRISYTKTLFSLFGWSPTITVNITNVQKSQPAGVLPLDTYGGGYYESTLFTGGTSLPSGTYIRDRFNFIPTTSALDIGKGITSLTDNDFKLSYVGATPPIAPKNSPFINFTTSFDSEYPNLSNKPHISFDERNGNWLANELLGGSNIETTNCSDFCGNGTIIGSTILCTTENYSVTTEATTVNWSVTSGGSLVTLSNATSNTATLTKVNATSSGYVTLSVTYSNDSCGNATATLQIWVGAPNGSAFPPIAGAHDWVCRGITTNNIVSISNNTTATHYRWKIEIDTTFGPGYNCNGVTNPSFAKFNSNQSTVLINAPEYTDSNGTVSTSTNIPAYTGYSTTPSTSINWGRCSGNYRLSLYALNACGEGIIATKNVTVGSPPSNPCINNETTNPSNFRMIVSPNPIKQGETNLSLLPNHSPCDIGNMREGINYKEIYGENYQIKVYDFYGEQKYEAEFQLVEDDQIYKFNVPNLFIPDNYYILEIIYPDEYIERQNIIIQNE